MEKEDDLRHTDYCGLCPRYVLKALTFETWIVETKKTFEHHPDEERLSFTPYRTPEGAYKKCQPCNSPDKNRDIFPRPLLFSKKLYEWVYDYPKKSQDRYPENYRAVMHGETLPRKTAPFGAVFVSFS